MPTHPVCSLLLPVPLFCLLWGQAPWEGLCLAPKGAASNGLGRLAGRRVRPPLAHPVPRGVSDSAVSRAQTPNAVSTVYPVGQWRPDVESKEFEVKSRERSNSLFTITAFRGKLIREDSERQAARSQRPDYDPPVGHVRLCEPIPFRLRRSLKIYFWAREDIFVLFFLKIL